MATQTDRLARIAAEGFAMIDELYGRPRRGVRNYSIVQGQKPQPAPYKGHYQVPQTGEPVIMGANEAAEKYGETFMMFNNKGKNPYSIVQVQKPQPAPYKGHYQVPQTGEPVIMGANEAAEKYGETFMMFNNKGGY